MAAASTGYAARPATAKTLARAGRFPVGLATLTLVDTHRTTPASGAFPGSAVRTLVTDVYYPATGGRPGTVTKGAPLDTSKGRFPLLVFAHGLGGERTNLAGTLAHLASHGYLVGAPTFPLTNISTLVAGTSDLADVVSQPGDLAFVIDSLTGSGDAAGRPFAAVVNAQAVGILGHSYGGTTALLAAYGGPLADARIKAAAAAAPASCFFGPAMYAGRSVPFLILHGTSDEFVDPAWSRETFAFMPAPRILAEIVGGDHVSFASGDPLLTGQRDTALIGLFGPLLNNLPGGFAAQGVALAIALASVPGGDVARCLKRPTFPDPNARRDPVIAADEQLRITNVALTAFFDAFVRRDRAARRFVLGLRRRVHARREVRVCADAKHSRPCHLPPLP